MAKDNIFHDRVILISFVVFTASLLFFVVSPSSFTASAFIHVDPESRPSFHLRADGRLLPFEDLILEQVGSSEIISPTVDSFGLGVGRTPQESASKRRSVISDIRNRLHVRRTGMRGVWELQYSSEGKAIDVAVFDDLIRRLTTSYKAIASQAREAQEAQRRLGKAVDDGMAETSAMLDSIGVASASAAMRQKLTEAQLAELRDQFAATEKARASVVPSSNPSRAQKDGYAGLDLAELQNARTRLDARKAELSLRYGPRHPVMVELDQDRGQVESLIDAESQLEGASTSAAAILSARAMGIQRSLAQAEILAASDREETSRLAQITSQLQASRADYEIILAQYSKAAPSEPLNVNVLSRPSAPQLQGPSAVRIVSAVLAFIATLVAAARLAMYARRRSMFDTSADVQRTLGLGVLAIIPRLPRPKKQGKGMQAADQPADALITGSNQAFGEAFQSMQRAFGIRAAGPKPQVVAVCSALPNEGKTTVSACFARSAAMSGCRVLLIDCDGRHAALSALFSEAKVRAGLVQLLRGDAKVEQAIAIDPFSGAYIIRHSSNGDVQDLSTPRLLKQLVDELRASFDLIILDTAPVLALTEARIIAAISDNVLLVARWRKTPINATRLAFSLLGDVGASVKGVALTLAKVG